MRDPKGLLGRGAAAVGIGGDVPRYLDTQRLPWGPIINARIQGQDTVLGEGHKQRRQGDWQGRQLLLKVLHQHPGSWDNLLRRKREQACDTWKHSLSSHSQTQKRPG